MIASDYVVNTFSYIWQRPVHDCLRHLAGQGDLRTEFVANQTAVETPIS